MTRTWADYAGDLVGVLVIAVLTYGALLVAGAL